MNQPLKASVVIPVYNGEKTIRACLQAVLACVTPEHEVIVVDDGSTDATPSILAEFSCHVIRLAQNKGRGHARNRGIEAARAPHVLLTDADCIVGENWISGALGELRRLKARDVRIVGAAGRILPRPGFFNKCDAYCAYGYNQDFRPRYTDNFCTSNLIVEREAVMSAGLFNEDLPTFEDLDLGLRLLERGCRLSYQPRMTVFHNHTRLGLRGFLAHEYEWGRSIGNYFEIRYPQYHWTPLSPWIDSIVVYAVSAPLFALGITLKIVTKNMISDPSVLLFTPFIFLSKIFYRIGALSCIMRHKIREGADSGLRRRENYGTGKRSYIQG